MLHSLARPAFGPLNHVFTYTCSREGAGLAEGIARLIVWGSAAIAVVALLATVAGFIIGRRRGAVGRQIRLHLAWGSAIVVAVPVLWVLWILIVGGVQLYYAARLEAWIAPLREVTPGELENALHAVLDAAGADTPARRNYLIATLPVLLEPQDAPLTAAERTALRQASTRLRADNTARQLGNHPTALDILDAAVAWRVEKPRLPAALAACHTQRACQHELVLLVDRWCVQDLERCRAALADSDLALLQTAVADDDLHVERIAGLRQQLDGLGH
jgi:hypothetical protein